MAATMSALFLLTALITGTGADTFTEPTPQVLHEYDRHKLGAILPAEQHYNPATQCRLPNESLQYLADLLG